MTIGEVIKTNLGNGRLLWIWGIYFFVDLIEENYSGYFPKKECSELTPVEKELL
jgi:hypothetical protein